jgi:hypothetical protein
MAENGKITGIITVPRLSAAGAEMKETIVNVRADRTVTGKISGFLPENEGETRQNLYQEFKVVYHKWGRRCQVGA